MIVRVSGTGQFELTDEGIHKLDEMDTALTAAIETGDAARFQDLLHATIAFVRSNGNPVGHERVVPSDVIIPPEDVDIHEARRFFTDEGLMAPLQA